MKRKLIYITIAVCVILALGFFAFKVHMQSGYSPLNGTLLDESNNITVSLLTNQLTSIRAALLQDADRIGKANSLCADINSDFSGLSSKVDGIFEIDSNNQVACSTNQSFVGTNATQLDSFAKFLSDPRHYPTMSRIYAMGSNPKMICGYVPILDSQGRYTGAIAAFTYVSNLGKHMPHSSSLAQAGYVVLYDDNGDILYHFDQSLVGKNRFSADLQSGVGNIQGLNEAFANAVAGKTTNEKIPYTVRGQNRLGEFRPVPVGTDHNFIILTSLPN